MASIASGPKAVISLAEIRSDAERLANNTEENGLLKILPAQSWLEQSAKRPDAKPLCGSLFIENELAILFAETAAGKSLFAVQIADSIASGRPISGFDLTAGPQPVLYLDFELSDKQFEKRYSDACGKHFRFSDRFHRAEINYDCELPDSVDFEAWLSAEIESAIKRLDIRVLIVDNLTYLRDEVEQAKRALPLMKSLKRLKSVYELSILALAHTPKRDESRPISINDLAGSKMLANFADSVFAIGKSQTDMNLRYLKQLKVRSSELEFSTDNVAVCEISKEDCFTGLLFRERGREKDHLKERSETERDEMIAQVKHLAGKGLTQRRIASDLRISLGTVNKYLNI